MCQRTATQPENSNREEITCIKNPVGENWCVGFNNACLAVLGVLPSPSWLHYEASCLEECSWFASVASIWFEIWGSRIRVGKLGGRGSQRSTVWRYVAEH